MARLLWANLAFAALSALAPAAHVLELPNKLVLDGPLWLAVQQHLYRGWSPFLGAPTEIGALATSLALLWRGRRDAGTRSKRLIASLAYLAMLAAFFVFNRPVNEALNGWTSTTLPVDWATYRLRWELGHAIAAVLAVVGLVSVVQACLIERDRGIGV